MNELQEKPDRRRERTRRALREALIALIAERGYDGISVSDIADRADINRATFYLHYKDKDDLLFRGMAEIYDAIGQHHLTITREQILSGADDLMNDASDFEHVRAHADFYRALFSERGSIAFTISMLDYLAETFCCHMLEPLAEGIEPAVPTDFIGAFLSGAEIGVIRWWLTRGDAYSPQQVAQMMYMMSIFGAAWALKFNLHGAATASAD
ncbi:TetR/AcrR family transcriptional regulator [Kamptonema cortianum]|jgi:AcrR family transcriptional regulator|nr:TetR/AcrR family transcriptional regulator [Kamptonema cortianum]